MDAYQWPPASDSKGVMFQQQLSRIVGFWDRWFEQSFFELDNIPYADNRKPGPACKASFTANTYRSQTTSDNACVWSDECKVTPRHIKRSSTNPCLFAHTAWQAFHFRREAVMKFSQSECTRCADANPGVQRHCLDSDKRLWCSDFSKNNRLEVSAVCRGCDCNIALMPA